jgi:hypothetical protein
MLSLSSSNEPHINSDFTTASHPGRAGDTRRTKYPRRYGLVEEPSLAQASKCPYGLTSTETVLYLLDDASMGGTNAEHYCCKDPKAQTGAGG